MIEIGGKAAVTGQGLKKERVEKEVRVTIRKDDCGGLE